MACTLPNPSDCCASTCATAVDSATVLALITSLTSQYAVTSWDTMAQLRAATAHVDHQVGILKGYAAPYDSIQSGTYVFDAASMAVDNDANTVCPNDINPATTAGRWRKVT